jgi:lysozyme
MTSPNQHLSISPRGVALIKAHEGFSSKWYVCPAGKTTIGYGHVKRQGDGVGEGPITEARAAEILVQDAATAVGDVRRYVEAPLNQNQFDALVSFVYNVGAANFKGSTLLKKLNAGDYESAAANFPRWIYANRKPLEGLRKRRAAERALFEGAA